MFSRAKGCLGCSGWLRPTTAAAAQGGTTPWDSTLGQQPCPSLPTQSSEEFPWPWSMACSSSCPPQNAGNAPQNALRGDKQNLCKGGVTSGRRHCTTGLIPVTGDPGVPSSCLCPDSSMDFLVGEGKGEAPASPPQGSPTVLTSEQWELAEFGQRHHPLVEPSSALPSVQFSPFGPFPSAPGNPNSHPWVL